MTDISSLNPHISLGWSILSKALNASDMSVQIHHLEELASQWKQLQDMLNNVDELPAETGRYAYDTSALLETVCTTLSGLHVSGDMAVSQLQPSRTGLTDVKTEDHESIISFYQSDSDPITETSFEFDYNPSDPEGKRHERPCHQWVIANIHNPYMPKELKDKLARLASVTRPEINKCLDRIRSQIGWRQILQAHFEGQQTVMTATTSQYFGKRKPQSRLRITHEIQAELDEMLDAAQTLYKKKFGFTELAGALSSAVVPPTPELIAKAAEEKRRAKQQRKRDGYREKKAIAKKERDMQADSLSSETSSTDEVVEPPASPINPRKRRSASQECSVESDRVTKRNRSVSSYINRGSYQLSLFLSGFRKQMTMHHHWQRLYHRHPLPVHMLSQETLLDQRLRLKHPLRPVSQSQSPCCPFPPQGANGSDVSQNQIPFPVTPNVFVPQLTLQKAHLFALYPIPQLGLYTPHLLVQALPLCRLRPPRTVLVSCHPPCPYCKISRTRCMTNRTLTRRCHNLISACGSLVMIPASLSSLI
jgi:hypothetical protein